MNEETNADYYSLGGQKATGFLGIRLARGSSKAEEFIWSRALLLNRGLWPGARQPDMGTYVYLYIYIYDNSLVLSIA